MEYDGSGTQIICVPLSFVGESLRGLPLPDASIIVDTQQHAMQWDGQHRSKAGLMPFF